MSKNELNEYTYINNIHKLFYANVIEFQKRMFWYLKNRKHHRCEFFLKPFIKDFKGFFIILSSSSHMVDHSERNNVVDYNYEPEGYF